MADQETAKLDPNAIFNKLLQMVPAGVNLDQDKVRALAQLISDFHQMNKTPLEVRDAVASDSALINVAGQFNLGTQYVAAGNQFNFPITITNTSGEPEVSAARPEPPRIYVSHCATEPESAALLNALNAQLKNAGFRVWKDDQRLAANAKWRYDLFDCMGRSNGAIIILSPSALKSELVADEARILLSRANDSMFKFVLFKLLADGVTEEQVVQSLPGGRRWSDIETVPNDTVTAQGDALANKIRAEGRLDQEEPLEILERRVGEVLSEVSKADLKRATQLLDPALPTWLSAKDFGEQLAKGLLKADSAQTSPALTVLRGSRKVKESDYFFLKDLADSSWVDPRSAVWIALVAYYDKGQRVLGLNAVRTETGRLCVYRACNLRPDYLGRDGGWYIAEAVAQTGNVASTNRVAGLLEATCRVINDELDRRLLEPPTSHTDPYSTKRGMNMDFGSEAVTKVTEELTKLLKVDSSSIEMRIIREVAAVRERLAHLEQDSVPFILLVGGKVYAEDLNILRAGFPTVTYLLLAGEQQLSIEHLAIMYPPLRKGE